MDIALRAFQDAPQPGADALKTAAPLERFLTNYPESAWRPAIQTNLGLLYSGSGYFSRAQSAFQDAWRSGRSADQPGTKRMIDRAVGQLAVLMARLGDAHELSVLLDSIGSRSMSGPATELLTEAREAAWMFRNDPTTSFLCGPLALKNLLLAVHADESLIRRLDGERSGPDGFTFAQISELARSLGIPHQVVRRRPAEPIPVPSIVNWKLNHFGVIVEQSGNRFHIKDPMFSSGDAWMSAEAINEEASGYFLVVTSTVPAAWQLASVEEMKAVRGRGKTVRNDDSATQEDDETIRADCNVHGMCVANAKEMLVSLHLSDIPVGYRPPIGPSVMVKLVYNQREAGRTANPMFFSVGPKWTMNFQSWIEDDPNGGPTEKLTRFPPGGGYVDYAGRPYTTGADSVEYQPDPRGGRLLRRPAQGPATSYEYVSPRGERFLYGYSDHAAKGTRRLFLTDVIDAQGKALHLEYAIEGSNANQLLRLKGILDATGLQTRFYYVPDKLQIQRIVDPFGRAAVLDYFPDGSLKSIKDVMGMTSSFSYEVNYECSLIGQGKLVSYYGDINISITGTGTGTGSAAEGRDTQYFVPVSTSGPLATDSGRIGSMTTPYGITTFAYGRDDSSNSRCLEIIDPEGRTERVEFRHQAPRIAASEAQVPVGIGDLKTANQYLDYRNSFYWDAYAITQMQSTTPGGLGLDFAKARITHWLHTAHGGETTSGIVESRKNPLESRVWYMYPGQTKSFNASASALPSAIARVLSDGTTQKVSLEYNDRMQVRRIVDPSGIITEVTYDANGLDILSIGRKASEAVALVELRGFSYDGSRRVTQIRMAGGNRNDYTYIGDNTRPTTRTDKAGRIDSYTYNALNQLTQIDLPGTALWKHFQYDGLGRLLKQTASDGYELNYAYDNLDRLTSVAFPDRSHQTYVYDKLDLHEVHSRTGVVRSYRHDGARRLRKIVDTSNVIVFDYYKNNALKSMTVDGNKTTRWDIDLQGRPLAKTYADGSQDHFAYDDHVSALIEKINPAGYKTSLKYRADGRLAELLQANRNVPDDVTVFSYDDPYFLRATSIQKGPVGGGVGTRRISFDFYPPLTSSGEPQPGAHQLRQESIDGVQSGPTFTYDTVGRLSTATLGMTSTYIYDVLGRMKTYHGLRDFEFVYEPESGRLKSVESDWLGTSVTYKDAAGDMRLDTLNNRPGNSYGYTYDLAGNIRSIRETRGGDTTVAQWKYDYDQSNRLTQGAKLPGVSTFGYDGSGNLSTLRGQTVTYNSLNQITSRTDFAVAQDQQRRYIYDSLNRLVEIVYAGNSSKHTRISYDPLGRISTISDVAELFGQTSWNVTELVWCGLTVCQEKSTLAGAGGFEGRGLTRTKAYFPEGYLDSRAGTVFYHRDHLGSVRETISDSGMTLASYDYDPYGQSLTGNPPPMGFAGMYFHAPSGLYFTRFRAYDPRLGRWLTRDPMSERGGPNLYAYANNSPTNYVDRSGLEGEATAVRLIYPILVIPEIWPLVAPIVPYLVVGGAAIGLTAAVTALPPLDIGGEPGAGVADFPTQASNAVVHPASEPGIPDSLLASCMMTAVAAKATEKQCAEQTAVDEDACREMGGAAAARCWSSQLARESNCGIYGQLGFPPLIRW